MSIDAPRITETKRRQKEADQLARQMFVDCALTLDVLGTKEKFDSGMGRAIPLAMVTMPAIFTGLTPAAYLDSKTLEGTVLMDNKKRDLKLRSERVSELLSISVWLQGAKRQLNLDRGKGGMVYVEPTFHPYSEAGVQRATIDDVKTFGRALESLPGFMRAEAVPIPKEVKRYEDMDDSELAKGLAKAQKLSLINERARIAIWGIAGFTFIATAKNHEGIAVTSMGVGFAEWGVFNIVKASLNRKTQMITDEIHSRS